MLNSDIDKLIFLNLPMTDKRSFLRTCKSIHKFSIKMPEIEAIFHKILNDTGYFHFRNYSALYIPLHKFTIELIYNDREIPDKYIIPENQILHQFPKIYQKLTERGQIVTIEKMLKLNRNNYGNDNIEFVAHGAAKTGNIKLLKHLHQSGYQFNFLTIRAATKAGKLKTLKWLIDHDAKLDDDDVIGAAIKKGHMRILKYLIHKGCTSNDAIFNAALYGQLKMIKFLHSVTSASLDHVIYGAGRGGHLEILKYAFKHGHKIDTTEYFGCNHLHILEWLIENDHFKYGPEMIDNMAFYGKLDCLQYMHSKGYNVLTESILKNAIQSRNMELIHWLYDICPDKTQLNRLHIHVALHSSSVKYDAHGSLPILKLFVSWGYNLVDSDCSIPARYGDLDILQYLFEHGCKLNERVINVAAEYGHLHIIIWCRQQGCDWSADTCKKTVQWNYLHVLKWLRGIDRNIYGLETDETEICPWDEQVCIEAINYDHIDVLIFALENGCYFGAESRAVVSNSKSSAIVNYIKNYFA